MKFLQTRALGKDYKMPLYGLHRKISDALPTFFLYCEENLVITWAQNSTSTEKYASEIVALYLETINVQGDIKGVKKTVTQTLSLESVYSSNGDRRRVTFMWKLITWDWWADGKWADNGELKIDQDANTKRFKSPIQI